jgi:hypothetical protein
MGRGMQSWTGYSYSDRIHAVTHVHPTALVDRRHVHGVTERIDVFGEAVIPLYEHEEAAARALADGVEAIVVHFLYSYLNPSTRSAPGDPSWRSSARATTATCRSTSAVISAPSSVRTRASTRR